ncbi:amidohydrolase family protein [Neoroseomonas lacus]|uniref:Amidohydrolase n=1 Tax=Neoroseomonas lacus TaxID=287609 RepID=A0A917KUW9_9PROT|nr:amidohydrolase family protein [Neoroseomonas lacus]GGJ31031.1 amidohydrolase [Neoroseomonas lacus]
MDFDLLLRHVRPPEAKPGAPPVDIGVTGGRIAAIAPALPGTAREEVDGGGRLVCSGFVETHIHLDKSCILARCACEAQRHPHGAMERVSAVKHTFTVEDVTERASRTIENCILHGATRMRTHVEVDPKVGLRGLEGVKALIEKYRWAIDLEICVMPQEGLTNNPGTDELMVAALRNGATVVGAAPNYDSDRAAQIRRVFEMARDFDIDIDMHLDSGIAADDLDTLLVCDLTEQYGWGGRVAVGHVTKLAAAPWARLDAVAKRMAGAGVALTVLTATDLYLGGRHTDHNVPRNVVDANRLAEQGVLCSVASNNILNPFTPFGDGQLLRQANLQAIVTHRGSDAEVRAVWNMTTRDAARLLRQDDYGIEVGNPGDLVVLDAETPEMALRTVAPVLAAFKRGRRTMTRDKARLHRP